MSLTRRLRSDSRRIRHEAKLLANLIHYNSGRENHPYVKLNCGAIPETLLESELFGHEKVLLLTRARAAAEDLKEANGGTLFLDEVGEMSLSAQVRLLRVLQDGEFTRVGGGEVLKTDVRVIAASNVDLERATEQGTFRRDLYYRLSVFPIELPPLRERPEDIHPLVIHFLEHYKQKTGRFISGISKDALQALMTYHWPGNVRELENAIERAVIIASAVKSNSKICPRRLIRLSSKNAIASRWNAPALRARDARRRLRSLSLHRWKKSSVRRLKPPRLPRGDKSHAARALGIGRKTLYRKLEQYNGKSDAG